MEGLYQLKLGHSHGEAKLHRASGHVQIDAMLTNRTQLTSNLVSSTGPWMHAVAMLPSCLCLEDPKSIIVWLLSFDGKGMCLPSLAFFLSIADSQLKLYF